MKLKAEHNLIHSGHVVIDCHSSYNDNTGARSLSQETLRGLDELGLILQKVHKRMTAEGYKIVDGNVVKTECK